MIELDVIAICGEFDECSMQTFVSDKSIDFSDFENDILIEQFGEYVKNNFIINDLLNILDLENMIEDLISNGYFENVSEAKDSSVNFQDNITIQDKIH